MTCERVTTPGGFSAIACGVRHRSRCACGGRATRLCDWKVPTKKSGTCDAPLCERCATSPSPDKDLCAPHAEAYEAWKRERAAT